MPLRDHFHSPPGEESAWSGVHGAWPTLMVIDLNKRLPAEFVARPRIFVGSSFEIDIAALEKIKSPRATPPYAESESEDANGGVATAVWAPPQPTFALSTEVPDQDEYEVRIYQASGMRLVAAVEIVSEANKDRSEARRAFAAKCATLLRQGVSVSIVDLVTSRRANLYAEMLGLLGKSDPSVAGNPPPIYAATSRWPHIGNSARWESWVWELAVGKPLPTMPVWLSPNFAVPLDLESTYEETCRVLRLD